MFSRMMGEIVMKNVACVGEIDIYWTTYLHVMQDGKQNVVWVEEITK
jgi:trans-aconitate methyltransferase